MKRKDPHTGEIFVPKRTNQIFANSANRIAYHNKKASKLRQTTAYINKPLHLNHRICLELMKGKTEAVFHKQFLLGMGFNFTVITNLEEHNGQKQYGLYRFMIIPLDKNRIKIITHD